MCLFPITMWGQQSTLEYKNQIKLNFNSKNLTYSSYSYSPIGPGLMLAGTIFTTAAILTVPNTNVRGVPQSSPYVKTTPRFTAMMLGITCFSVGCVLTIGGR